MRFFVILALAAAVAAVAPSRSAVDSYARELRARWGESRLNESTSLMIAEEQLQWILDNRNETTLLINREPEPLTTECPKFAPRTPPTNINDLRPQDVRVIGAVGDSVSTGCNSLSGTWLNMKDYQGIAWSMGGDNGALTMANLLGDYTTLIGPSLGTSGDSKGFNYAKNGAVVQDTPTQAKDLVAAMRTSPAVRFEEDWKVVTVLIGGNNLCDVCFNDPENNAAAYERDLKKTLDILSLLPRTFVNLVQHLDYTQIAQFKGPFCGLALRFVCDCLTTTNGDKKAHTQATIDAYNVVIEKLAAEYRRDDFAVVSQPMLAKSVIPDRSYITYADCFHPSGEGHRMFATALWNSMIMPKAQKSGYIATANDAPACAQEDTSLYVD